MSDLNYDLGSMMDQGQGYVGHRGDDGGLQMMDGTTMTGGGGLAVAFGVLSLVLLLLALTAVVTHLVLHATGRLSAGARSPGTPTGEARAVLDGRLARGEVSAEEYSSTRSLLDA